MNRKSRATLSGQSTVGAALIVVLLLSLAALQNLGDSFSQSIAGITQPQSPRPAPSALHSSSQAASGAFRALARGASRVSARAKHSSVAADWGIGTLEQLARRLSESNLPPGSRLTFTVRAKHASMLEVEDTLRNAGFELPKVDMPDARGRFSVTTHQNYVPDHRYTLRSEVDQDVERMAVEVFDHLHSNASPEENVRSIYQNAQASALATGHSQARAHDIAYYGARHFLELKGSRDLLPWSTGPPDLLQGRPQTPSKQEFGLDNGLIPLQRNYWDDDITMGVFYLPAELRQFHRTSFSNSGTLLDAWGRPFHTLDAYEHIFVLDEADQLYEGIGRTGYFHHSSLMAGDPIRGAGTFRAVNGRLLEITNSSGHYLPDRQMFGPMQEMLQAAGANTTDLFFINAAP